MYLFSGDGDAERSTEIIEHVRFLLDAVTVDFSAQCGVGAEGAEPEGRRFPCVFRLLIAEGV